MDDMREKIAHAINDWLDGCGSVTQSDYEIADVVLQVLREQEPVGELMKNGPAPLEVRLYESVGYGTALPHGTKFYIQSMPASVPEEWREAVQEFVDRVDRGEIRSKYTYAKFQALLAAAPKPEDK